VADVDYGLRVIYISDPDSPTETGFYYTPGYACGVAVSNNYAYVADYDYGLRVINISDPASPTETGFYDTPGDAYGVAVSGSYIFVADGDSGLRLMQPTVLEISFGTKPAVNGIISPGEWQDASLVTFKSGSGVDSVWIKHFQDTVFVAVRNFSNASSLNDLFLDMNYDRASLPQTDDRILACSSTEITYEKTGTGTAWQVTPIAMNGWVAVASVETDYWVSEWKIDYSKLGLVQGVVDSFGMALSHIIGFDWYNWTITTNTNVPYSWMAITSRTNWGMPGAALNLSSYDFGPVHTGDSAVSGAVYVKNTGTYSLLVESIVLTSGPFTLLTPAPFTVAANDSHVVSIKFKPGQFISYNDTVTVTTNDLANHTLACVFTGTGAEPAAVVDVPFGSKPAFDGVLSAGEWSDAVFITPHKTALNDTIWFKYNIDTLYVGFKGSDSVANNQQQLYFDNDYDRATLPISDDHRLRIQIDGYKDEGIGDGSGWIGASINGWDVIGTTAPGKWFSEWKLAFSKLSITPGQPDSLGMSSLVYSFASGGNSWPSTFGWENPSTWGMMKSSQNWGIAGIAVNENQHDFGYIKPDDSLSWASLYIKNTGSLGLAIDSLRFVSSYFRTDQLSDSLLAPGDSVAVVVWFKPGSPGIYQDTLRIYSTDPANNPLKVSLAGYGAYVIDVPWGTIPAFDSSWDPTQWADAYSDTFVFEDKTKKYYNVDTFFVKYNADTLYLVLITPDYTGFGITSHSLMFDTIFDRTPTVQNDDYRFMVTFEGDPLEFIGFEDQWAPDKPTAWRSDFSAKTDFITFYAIPFDRLGLSIGANDTIGFAVLADGEAGIFGRWPVASDSVGPATWGILTSSAGWTGVAGQPDDQPKIKSFSLANAYPNPASKQVNLSYQLPAPANVRLNIYNIAGQLVKCFDQGHQPAGSYSIRYNTGALPNGIYFYQIDAGSFKATKKLMVIR